MNRKLPTDVGLQVVRKMVVKARPLGRTSALAGSLFDERHSYRAEEDNHAAVNCEWRSTGETANQLLHVA